MSKNIQRIHTRYFVHRGCLTLKHIMKNKINFMMKNSDIFRMSAQNIDGLCMASRFTIYSINQISDLIYQISYIIYKISDILY